MVQRDRESAAHLAVATERAVESGHAAHFEDQPHAVALFPHQPAGGLLKLRFAAGVGAVAQLIFEPLQANGVARAVRQQTRQEEAA